MSDKTFNEFTLEELLKLLGERQRRLDKSILNKLHPAVVDDNEKEVDKVQKAIAMKRAGLLAQLNK